MNTMGNAVKAVGLQALVRPLKIVCFLCGATVGYIERSVVRTGRLLGSKGEKGEGRSLGGADQGRM